MADVYAVLVPELRDDPAGLGYAGKPDAERLALLTAKTRARPAPMRLGVFNQFLMARGLLKGIRAGQEHADATVASVCIGLMLQFQGNADKSIDPADPATLALVDVLLAAGIASAADKAAFLAAAVEPCSRADQLGLTNLGLGHLRSARDQIGG